MPRYSKRNTIEELKAELIERYMFDEDVDYDDLMYDIDDDLKVKFDFENMSIPIDDTNNYRIWAEDTFYQLGNYAVLLCGGGGDWESPVKFCIYIDNKNKVRCYIPTRGNPFNKHTMTAYGSENSVLYRLTNEDRNKLANKMPAEWFNDPNSRIVKGRFDFSDKYYNFVESELDKFSDNGMMCDLNEILDDIKSRITVKEDDLVKGSLSTSLTLSSIKTTNSVSSNKQNIRYAKKSTIDELKSKLEKKYRDPDNNYYFDIYGVYGDVPSSDKTVDFDLENCDTPFSEDYVEEYEVGFYQLGDFAVMICVGGGDWEEPVAFCIYLDDCDNFRMYIPTEGNRYNIYTMTAFGTEFMVKNCEDKMPDDWFEDPSCKNADDFDNNFSDEYYRNRNVELDKNKMLEEIRNNIVVKN